jgi:hypothetical protein
MPRFEILYHATCDFGCTSAEEAAAIVHAQMADSGAGKLRIHQLAVWREDGDADASPLDPATRAQLDAFFNGVQRCAQEAEERFRGDVEAILLALPIQEAASPDTENDRESSCTK